MASSMPPNATYADDVTTYFDDISMICAREQYFYSLGAHQIQSARDECHGNETESIFANSNGCPRTFDCVGCWPETPAGEDAIISCPGFVKYFNPSMLAKKTCTENGSWYVHPGSNNEWANYSACLDFSESETSSHVTIYVFIGGYTFSILTLIISLIIFIAFRQLRCDRITLHKNLFASFILNGVFWILYYTCATLDGPVLHANPVWCQVLHVFCQYFTACNFFWMFCEGFYLHTVIVVAFHRGKTLIIACAAIGWVIPLFLTAVYTALRRTSEDKLLKYGQFLISVYLWCWADESTFQWIIYGPIVASLLANVAFLTNIIRVILTKLRAVDTPDTVQSKKAVRATLILVPLLGLQYVLLPFRPDLGSDLEEPYLYTVALVTSLQGALVSVIYCFLNTEVLSVLRRRWNQLRLMRGGTMATRLTSANTVETMTYTDTMCNTSISRDTSTHKALCYSDKKDSVELRMLTPNGSPELIHPCV